MKMQKIFLVASLASAIALVGCGGDKKKKPKVNTSPTTANAMLSAQADTELKGKLAASDADGDALTYTVTKAPTNGKLMLNADGSYTYMPNADTTGEDSFDFSVSDGQASANATAKITIGLKDVTFDDYARKAYAQEATANPLPLNTRNIDQNVTDPKAFDDLLSK